MGRIGFKSILYQVKTQVRAKHIRTTFQQVDTWVNRRPCDERPVQAEPQRRGFIYPSNTSLFYNLTKIEKQNNHFSIFMDGESTEAWTQRHDGKFHVKKIINKKGSVWSCYPAQLPKVKRAEHLRSLVPDTLLFNQAIKELFQEVKRERTVSR